MGWARAQVSFGPEVRTAVGSEVTPTLHPTRPHTPSPNGGGSGAVGEGGEEVERGTGVTACGTLTPSQSQVPLPPAHPATRQHLSLQPRELSPFFAGE